MNIFKFTEKACQGANCLVVCTMLKPKCSMVLYFLFNVAITVNVIWNDSDIITPQYSLK